MSVVGNLSRHLNLAELAEPRDFPTFQSVATRQAEARGNMGVNASATELGYLAGAVAGTAGQNKVMVTASNRSIGGGWRDTRTVRAQTQAAPVALNATGTLTAAMMVAGLITSTSGAAVTATLDTGTLLETAIVAGSPSFASTDFIDFSVVNTGGNTFTIATAAGWTDGGNAFVAVAGGTSATFRARKTAANTYTLYKIA